MSRPKSQFCKYEHDTSICGRDSRNACNDCKRIWTLENKEYYKNYHLKNRDALLEKQKKYREENKEIIAIKEKEFWDAHKDQKHEIDHLHYIENREKYAAYNVRNQTNRNLREVAWTDWYNVELIYKNQPHNTEIDHYIPLQGDLVSGLHVSWNLQYLTPTQNASKSNNCDLLEVSNWYGKLLVSVGLK